MKFYQRFFPYAVAIGSTAIALFLTFSVEPFLYRTIGAFFYIAIIVSSWSGGWRPGSIAVVLSILAINYWFIPPRFQFRVERLEDGFQIGIFILVSCLINLLTSNFRDSKQKIERLNQQLAQENAAQLRMALSAAQMGLWNWNLITGEINWSPEHEYLFGFSPGQFDGKYETFEACLHPEDREKLNHAIKRSLRERIPYQHEFRVVWADGSIHWLEGRGQAYYNGSGQPVRMAGTIMAIDERKQTEMALQQLNVELEQRVAERTTELSQVNDHLLETLMEQQYTQLLLLEQAQLLDLAHDTILTCDLNGVITFWNQGAELMYGWTKTEAFGQEIHSFLHTEFPKPLAEIESELRERGYWEGELIHTRKEGSMIMVASRWVMQKDEKGRPIKVLEINNDITAQKQAEAVLQQSLLEIEDLYNNAPCGYHSLDARGNVIRINKTELNWLGYNLEEVLHKTFSDFLTAQSQKVFQDNFPKFKKQGWINNLELEIVCKNSTIRWFSLNATAIKDEAGNFVMSRSTLFEITERKRDQQMLELQAVITRNMAEGVCLVKPDNAVIVYANPKFEQMLGYHSGELNGQNVSIINYGSDEVTPEDVSQAIRAAVLENRELSYEVHNVKKDGTPIWCSATCSVFNHPEYGTVLVAVQQDITEAKRLETARQQAEEELRQSEAKFRSLSDCSPMGIFMMDIQGQYIYTNPRCQTICGYTFDQALGDGWMQFLHPEDRDQAIAEWSNAVSQKQEYSGEIRYLHPDLTIRFGRVQSVPIFSITHELLGYVGTVEDITNSRAIEQMKSEFISVVSHELRTPLTSIRGSLGLLAAGVFKNKPEVAQQMLNIASHDTERLVRLVNDILDLERLEANKVNLNKQWCDAETLLQQSVKIVQSLAGESQIILLVESNSIQVFVDSDRIIQTIVNLVSNAIKFSPPDSTVTLSLQDQADRVLVQIKDQGRGIPADKLDKIFGRFQQVDASDSRQKGGTGLGLAICKSIVQQHGGKIWVESIVEKGSCFSFTLPKLLD